MIVGEVSGECAPKMPLGEDDHVIETFATNGSDHALDVGILPRTRRCRDHFPDAQAGDSTTEDVAIDGVPIPEEPSGGGLLRKCLDDLLGRPRRRGMLRDAEIDDTPTVMGQQNEASSA